MRSTRPEPGIIRVLVVASGAVAALVAAANVTVLARAGDVARLRDLRLVARARVFLDAHAPTLLGRLPEILHVPFDLGRGVPLAIFLALAVVVHLVLAWTAAALATPLVVPLARRGARDAAWRRGFPLAVVAATSVPIVAHRLSLWTSAGTTTIWIASLGIAAVAWLGATRLVRTHAASLRLVRGAQAVTLAAVAIGALGVAGQLTRTARGGAEPPPPPPATPNVLLVSIDTLRPDHLGSYGYARATSPTIDALAAGGARFTTAVSPTSWTLPAHMTLLTALPPDVHGVESDGLRLDASVVTLAEVLRMHGYATAGFVSGPYLDAGYGFARGFAHYDDYTAVRISRPAAQQAHTSPALVGAVTAWLDGWNADPSRRPFFVFVHMWDPHYDYNPPPPYDTMFDADYAGSVTGLDVETGDTVHLGMPARDLAHVVALYDGEIRYTDAHLARLVDALTTRHLLDDTVIVVTSDHGEEFFEHGKKGHRNALYDESIRIPLVLRYPARVEPGTVVENQVRLMDVAPTILDLTHTPIPETFGLSRTHALYAPQSLVGMMTNGPPIAPLPAVADLQPHALTALRHQTQKLILAPFTTDKEQLYDLKSDPTERTNLATKDPTNTTAMRSELSKWQDTARLAAKQAQSATMSEDHKAALRALGYVE